MVLFITSRNGISIIHLEKVVYLKADGNYTDFHFLSGKVKTQLSTLSVFDEQIRQLYDNASTPSPFFRMGRSYIVNTEYVSAIDQVKGTIAFDTENVKTLPASRTNLKALRDFIVDTYTLKGPSHTK